MFDTMPKTVPVMYKKLQQYPKQDLLHKGL